MAFSKKTWKDRLVEFPGRRLLTRISGSADVQMVVDVSRNEGTISQAGDAFSAANMNDLEQRVGDAFNELNENLQFPDGSGFYPDEKDGQRGYNTDPARGADTFFPFNKGLTGIKLLKSLYILYQTAESRYTYTATEDNTYVLFSSVTNWAYANATTTGELLFGKLNSGPAVCKLQSGEKISISLSLSENGGDTRVSAATLVQLLF